MVKFLFVRPIQCLGLMICILLKKQNKRTNKIYGSNREELYFYRIEKFQMSYDSINDILFDFFAILNGLNRWKLAEKVPC